MKQIWNYSTGVKQAQVDSVILRDVVHFLFSKATGEAEKACKVPERVLGTKEVTGHTGHAIGPVSIAGSVSLDVDL